MASPVSSITKVRAQTGVQTEAQPSAERQAAPAPNPPPPVTDTVHISDTAKVLQARIEAPAQTVNAAASGDLQAKATLAKP
jgi:hypothetical protein